MLKAVAVTTRCRQVGGRLWPSPRRLRLVSFLQGKPVKTFIIRKEAKGHGKGRMVEGPALTGTDRIVVIDDVATTGKAFLHSLEALAQDGLKPVKCACLIDRQDGAKEALAAKGVELVSLFTAAEFLKD